jgi:DNA polymerase III delta prime subunit
MVNSVEMKNAAQPAPVSARKPHENNPAIRKPATPELQFRRAIKHDAKLRLAISGPSGSGKTYTLLKIASELGGPVALVDTEHGSASKYADLFEFDVLELDSYDPGHLLKIIDQAAEAGFRALCIDSLSHFWMGKDGELEMVDRAARRMQNPNSFAAWKQVTPIHNALIDKMIGAPLHILASMRTKTEWILDRDERTAKTMPRKVGLAPVMRDGIEYEFDVCGEMDQENTLQITKSRCPRLAGGVFMKPGAELSGVLKEWLVGAPYVAGDAEKPHEAPVLPVEARTKEVVKDSVPPQATSAVPVELASIWKRMCSPRGVVKELDQLGEVIEELAGATGVAEYFRLLRQHGVERPKDFKTAQPARLCAKDVFALVEELRANARENALELEALENERSAAGQATDSVEAS